MNAIANILKAIGGAAVAILIVAFMLGAAIGMFLF